MPYRLIFSAALVLGLLSCSPSDTKAPEPSPQASFDAQNDTYTLRQAELSFVAKDKGVLQNDSLPASFELKLLNAPLHGKLELFADGSFSYKAETSTIKQDGFSYSLQSGDKVSSAEVSLHILAETNPNPSEPNPDPTQPLCPETLVSGEAFECQLESGTQLLEAPSGMVLQERSGLIRWTPTAAQSKTHTIKGLKPDHQAFSFNITVKAGTPDLIGLYVSPEGDDADLGDAEHPFKNLQHAVDLAEPGTTIYLRGGNYYHPEYGQAFDGNRTVNTIAKIIRSGTQDAPITLKAYGNEFVKLLSDEDALIFNEANYWIVEGLELAGSSPSLDYETAIALWWSEDASQTSGRGISNRRSQHLSIRDCIIHDFPGAGIGSNGADFVTIENNLIYNNGWWSTAGTHGVANSYLTTLDPSTANQEKLIMRGNLVFANQSLIISHVFSKGRVSLVLDEGNGLHAQNNRGTFLGKARVENNLLLFNGKAGFGINTMDDIIVRNNSFYLNARVVDGAGELTLQSSAASDISANLFVPRDNRLAIKDFQKTYINVGNNLSSGNQSTDLPSSVVFKDKIFQDPEALDFRPTTGIANTMGVPETDLERMFKQVTAYGVEVRAPEQVTDSVYMQTMKQRIFDTWPSSYSSLILEDKASGFSYTYEQRCYFPEQPASEPCPAF